MKKRPKYETMRPRNPRDRNHEIKKREIETDESETEIGNHRQQNR